MKDFAFVPGNNCKIFNCFLLFSCRRCELGDLLISSDLSLISKSTHCKTLLKLIRLHNQQLKFIPAYLLVRMESLVNYRTSFHDDDLEFRSLPRVFPRTDSSGDGGTNMSSHSQIAVISGDAHVSYKNKAKQDVWIALIGTQYMRNNKLPFCRSVIMNLSHEKPQSLLFSFTLCILVSTSSLSVMRR